MRHPHPGRRLSTLIPMSANAELSRIFKEMAVVLELTGANPFRVNAHTRVARALGDLKVDVAEIADLEKLTGIEGIGQGTAAKILEFLETGRITEHDDLLEQIPRGLLEVLQIPGLGPKTVKLLWEQAGVTDRVTLQMHGHIGIILHGMQVDPRQTEIPVQPFSVIGLMHVPAEHQFNAVAH